MGWTILMYMAIVAIGATIGGKFLKSDKEYNWIKYLQIVALIILIFTMGARIGADDRVISSLSTVGLSAAIISGSAVIGSVLFVFIGRKLLRINKQGVKKND